LSPLNAQGESEGVAAAAGSYWFRKLKRFGRLAAARSSSEVGGRREAGGGSGLLRGLGLKHWGLCLGIRLDVCGRLWLRGFRLELGLGHTGVRRGEQLLGFAARRVGDVAGFDARPREHLVCGCARALGRLRGLRARSRQHVLRL